MHRIFLIIFGIMSTIGAFLYVGRANLGDTYVEYQNLFDYRRLHPELLPSPRTIRLTDAGHTNVYADIIWIQLIQYIGDNIGNGKYLEYTEKLVWHIVELHPHFTKAYILGLLLIPSLDPDSPSYIEGNEKKWSTLLALADTWLHNNCDKSKLDTILSETNYELLWKNMTLRNPCTDGYIAYNAWFIASTLKENKKAEQYYLIASMQDDAPQAAKVLTILMRAKSGDYLSAAQKFLLIASSGYDESPYICRESAQQLLVSLEKNKTVSTWFLTYIEKITKNIPEYTDLGNPLLNSTTNCRESVYRWAKQLYLEYITTKASWYPLITTGTELVSQNIISHVPKIPWQDDYNVFRKKDGSWVYRKIN